MKFISVKPRTTLQNKYCANNAGLRRIADGAGRWELAWMWEVRKRDLRVREMNISMASMWRCACLCVLVMAATEARVLERCELARELTALGVPRSQVPTWVCIAFHESRFDTEARNPHSGDHGLLQISELYWCGAGKACGLPCDRLRDPYIEDDVRCALQIFEEHTRLQGDGFLAWVVYPQHCKHNTKKYIVDCDMSLKNTTLKASDRARSLNDIRTYEVDKRIEVLKSPYLNINAFIHPKYAYPSQEKSDNNNWLNFKIDNIDDLRLPVFNNPTVMKTLRPLATSTPVPQVLQELNKITDAGIKKTTTSKPLPTDGKIFKFAPFEPMYVTTTPRTFAAYTIVPTSTAVTTVRNGKKLNWFYKADKDQHNSTATTPTPTTTTILASAISSASTPTTTSRPLATSTPRIRASTASTELNVFDLYLNTRRPMLSTYSFAPFVGKRLTIFSGGSTAAPSFLRATSGRVPQGGAARNHFRRQIVSNSS